MESNGGGGMMKVSRDQFSMKEFMDMIRPYPVVLNCSKISDVVAEKEKAVAFLLKEYESTFGQSISRQKFLKKLNNLKTRFRMTIKYFEKNKLPVKLKPWEKVLAEMLKKNRIPFKIKGLDASEEINEEPSISGIEEPHQNDSNYSQVPLDNSDNYEIKSEKSLSINDCDENDTCDNNSNFTESPLRQLLQNHRLYPVLSQFLNARSLAEQISLQQQQQQNRVNSSPPPLNFLRPQSLDETNSPSPSVPNQAEFNNTTKKKIKTIPGEKEETKNLTNKQLERLALIEHIEFTRIQREYYAEKLKLLKK